MIAYVLLIFAFLMIAAILLAAVYSWAIEQEETLDL